MSTFNEFVKFCPALLLAVSKTFVSPSLVRGVIFTLVIWSGSISSVDSAKIPLTVASPSAVSVKFVLKDSVLIGLSSVSDYLRLPTSTEIVLLLSRFPPKLLLNLPFILFTEDSASVK